MGDRTYQSPNHAPDFVLHREVYAADAAADTERAHGMLMQDYQTALIQVVPYGGANPDIEVMWWSEEAGSFISDVNPITYGDNGADTPFEFAVEANGRRLWVKIPTLAAGGVKVYVAGFGSRLS